MIENSENNNLSKDELDIEYLTKEEITTKLPIVYTRLNTILNRYLDIDEKEQKILSYWIISANYYDAFEAFPILYINASKGSGKTRLLKLINALLPDHLLVSNITEAALFRAAMIKRGIELDEAERMQSKEKTPLRELLNVCYKRGGKVLRVEKGKDGKQTLSEFETYIPVALANVYGLESVLEDRCIGINLQKTANQRIMRTPELFSQDQDIQQLKTFFGQSLVFIKESLKEGILDPFYKRMHYQYTHSTDYTHSTLTTEDNTFYDLVYSVQIDGRSFELWLPLFAISWLISSVESVVSVEKKRLDEVIELAKAKVKTKQEDEITDDRDTNFAVVLYSYINANGNVLTSQQFIAYYKQENGDSEWLSSIVFGKFLKRAGITERKLRLAKGFEITISIEKLKDYLKVRNALEINKSNRE